MIVYPILIVASTLVGAAAVLLWPRKDMLDPKLFLAGALLNVGALLGMLLYRRRSPQ